MDSGKLRIKGTDKLLFYPHEKKFGFGLRAPIEIFIAVV